MAHPGRDHRGDALAETGPDQVVLGLDDGDERSLKDVLARASAEDEVAITVEAERGVEVSLHA